MTKALYILLFLLTPVWFIPDPLYAQSLKVGSGEYIKTVTEAIRQADHGDTIFVSSGVYKEGNILINKPLVLIGIGFPVLDGEGKNEILTVVSDSVTIQGFHIRNVGVSYLKDQAGIKITGSTGSIISGNQLKDTFFGIMLEKSFHCTVEGNSITGNAVNEISSGNAIHLWYCDSMVVRNNDIRNHRDGIYLEFVNASYILNNVSEDNLRYGLHFMFSNQNDYIGNTFRNNGAGVAVMFSRDITMQNNNFERNWGSSSYGLLLKEIYDSEISGNEFSENTSAIYAEGANRCLVSNNNFRSNGWALKISGNCDGNIFTRNNFFSNTFDLSTNSKHNYNTYLENYWSEYNGYDLDKDGVGDVPYQPVKLFSYVVDRVPPSIILLRSLFIDLINYAEKVAPAFSPASLVDPSPLMKPVK